MIRKYNLKDFEVDYCKSLYDFYRDEGNERKAQYYQLQYFKTKDEIERGGKLRNIGELQFLDRLQSANEEIIIMARQRKLLYVIILLVGVIASLTALALTVIMRKNRKLNESHKVMFARMQDLIKNDDMMRRTRDGYEKQIESLQSELASQSQKQRYVNSTMGEAEKEEIYDKVCLVMADTEVICKDDFNLKKLSGLVRCPYPKVSQAINELSGKNFNAILNDYRIKEACRRLTDKNFGHLTIEAVAASVGFKSRTTFVATFKKITGLTPSEYQKTSVDK